jgi:hypothetical protein
VREATPIIAVDVRGRLMNYAGTGLNSAPVKSASQPCPHLPGTEGKVAELERRAEAGELLWHPEDAVESDEPLGISCGEDDLEDWL